MKQIGILIFICTLLFSFKIYGDNDVRDLATITKRDNHYIKFPISSTGASNPTGYRWETESYKLTMFPNGTNIPLSTGSDKDHLNCPIQGAGLKDKIVMTVTVKYQSKKLGDSYVYIPIYTPEGHSGKDMVLKDIFPDCASQDSPVPILEAHVEEGQKEMFKKILLQGGVIHVDPIFNVAYRAQGGDRFYKGKELALNKMIKDWGGTFGTRSKDEWRMKHIGMVPFPSKDEIFSTNILRTGTEEGLDQDTYDLIVGYNLDNYPKISNYTSDLPIVVEGKVSIEGGHFIGKDVNSTFTSGGFTMTENTIRQWNLSEDRKEIAIAPVPIDNSNKGLQWLFKLRLEQKEQQRRMGSHTIKELSNKFFDFEEEKSIVRYRSLTWAHDGISKKVKITTTGSYESIDGMISDTETVEISMETEQLETFSGSEYYLDYDVKKAKFRHEVNDGSPFVAKVELPQKSYRNWQSWWDGNTEGDLSYSLEDSKGLVQDKETEEYGLINEGSEEIVREPVLMWETDKIDVFGDIGIEKAQNKEASFFINTLGGISRMAKYSYEEPYTAYEYGTDSQGNETKKSVTKYRTETGEELVTDEFSSNKDKVTVQGLFFDGSKMPLQSFGGQIGSYEDNKYSQSKRTLVWEGERYNIPTKRFMRYVDEEQKTTDIVEKGGYGGKPRVFQHVDKVDVTYVVETSLNEHFQADRENAKYNPNNYKGKTFYYAPFATDQNLQGYDYPIKSGYFYAPHGVYEVKVRTTIYKEGSGGTQKHKDIVNQVKDSFDATITLPTMKLNGDAIIGLDSRKYDDIPVKVGKNYVLEEQYKLPYSNGPSSIGGYLTGTESSLLAGTDPLYKKILQGWDGSGSSQYWDTYQYREYVKNANVYKITEETVLKFTLNPLKERYYIVPKTKNGAYNFNVGFKPFNNGYVTVGKTIASKPVKKLDGITFTVVGSMYDDQSSR